MSNSPCSPGALFLCLQATWYPTAKQWAGSFKTTWTIPGALMGEPRWNYA